MGEDDSCTDNSIEIFDGPWAISRSFGKKCTSWQKLTLSTTNNLFVVFKSSGIGRFLATYQSLGRDFTLSEPKGFISSPGYPLGNQVDTYYTWRILGDADTYIVLNITDYEFDTSCNYDYLKIFDGSYYNAPLIGKICDSSSFLVTASTGNSMLLELNTKLRGFYGNYEIRGKSTFIHATFGSIVSPGYPFGIRTNKPYYWSIIGDPGTSLHLNITSFELEETFTYCSYYTVNIYDGSNDSSLLLSQLCGASEPGYIASTSNSMYIVFRTDVAKRKAGFYATFYFQDLPYGKSCYRVDQCRSNLTCVRGFCVCPSDTYYNNSTSTCYQKIAFKENCTEKQHCKSNLLCLNATCSCDTHYYYNRRNDRCTQALDHYSDCNDTVSSMCKSSKNLDCLPDVNGKSRCLCMDSFYFENNTCVSMNYFVQRPQAKNKNTTGVELHWAASAFGSNISYSVSWVSDNDESDKGTQAANESGVTVTGLTPGTSYTITVFTILQLKGLYTSRNINTTLYIVTYPAQPGHVNVSASKLDQPTYAIRFQQSEGRVHNYIFSFGAKLPLRNTTVTSPEVYISDLQADTDYKYTIKAVNSVRDESAEVEGSFKTGSSTVSAESNIGMITGATVGSLVFVALLVVFSILIYGTILHSKAKAKQNTRDRQEQVDSINENEEAYDSLDETSNQMSVNVDHYDRYNLIQGINPEQGLVNSPPLPPRPQPNKYIDLRRVPIKITEQCSKDISIHFINAGIINDLQEENNSENSDQTQNNYLRLINTPEFMTDLLNQTEENKNLDGISSETETASTVNDYDSLMPPTARTEENKYLSFSDDHHKNPSDDKVLIGADKDGYLTPTKPAESDKKTVKIDDQNELKSIQNCGYLTLDGEEYTVDSSESKYIHVHSCQGSPSLPIKTDQIDEEDDQSYIHPIDPDDPSLPISYGYHTWDGAEDASNQDKTDTEV